MTRKQISNLAIQSFDNDSFDAKKIAIIVKNLNRTDLKRYIRALRLLEQEKEVIVTLSTEPDETAEKKFSTLFPNKKITYNTDPSLIAGVRIVNNDMLFEMSLKERIESLADNLKDLYD